MPNATMDELNDLIIELVDVARHLGEGSVTSIHVDVQDSGEYPYRLMVREQVLPFANVARAPDPHD